MIFLIPKFSHIENLFCVRSLKVLGVDREEMKKGRQGDLLVNALIYFSKASTDCAD